MEVRVIVLLEIGCNQSAGLDRLCRQAKAFKQLSNDWFIIVSIISSRLGSGTAFSLTRLGLFWSLNCNSFLHVRSRFQLGSDSFDIVTLERRHAKVSEDQVRAGPYEVQMYIVIYIEDHGLG